MEREKIISILLLFVLAAFILLIAFIAVIIFIRSKKNQDIRLKETMQKDFSEQLRQSQSEVQEQTFQQLGKELHDNVGQLLSSSKMLLGLAERALVNPPDTLRTANATLGQAINELRNLSKSLDKEWLVQFNFSENLQVEIARINSSSKVLAIYHKKHEIQLIPDEQIILFRIVQEAIQNSIKHAFPKNIEVTTEEQEGYFNISMVDDGKGFEIKDCIFGLGINNIKHRTLLLGGSVTWDSKLGKGTTVTIILPQKKYIV